MTDSGPIKPIYKRVLLKLSGEVLMGSQPFGIDAQVCASIASLLTQLCNLSLQVGIVIGGGNIFRGIKGAASGMERAPSDHIGMLATIINGITLQQALKQQGCPSHVMSALGATDIVEAYCWEKSLTYLDKGEIVIFVGGTGHPYFTTDTAAALRAAQTKSEILLKATKVDGIYDKDPMKYPNTKRFDRLSHKQVLSLGLSVMDPAAVSICLENHIPIKVFSTFSLFDAVTRSTFGTLVTEEA